MPSDQVDGSCVVKRTPPNSETTNLHLSATCSAYTPVPVRIYFENTKQLPSI